MRPTRDLPTVLASLESLLPRLASGEDIYLEIDQDADDLARHGQYRLAWNVRNLVQGDTEAVVTTRRLLGLARERLARGERLEEEQRAGRRLDLETEAP